MKMEMKRYAFSYTYYNGYTLVCNAILRNVPMMTHYYECTLL